MGADGGCSRSEGSWKDIELFVTVGRGLGKVAEQEIRTQVRGCENVFAVEGKIFFTINLERLRRNRVEYIAPCIYGDAGDAVDEDMLWRDCFRDVRQDVAGLRTVERAFLRLTAQPFLEKAFGAISHGICDAQSIPSGQDAVAEPCPSAREAPHRRGAAPTTAGAGGVGRQLADAASRDSTTCHLATCAAASSACLGKRARDEAERSEGEGVGRMAGAIDCVGRVPSACAQPHVLDVVRQASRGGGGGGGKSPPPPCLLASICLATSDSAQCLLASAASACLAPQPVLESRLLAKRRS